MNIDNLMLKDILNNNTLYEVYENDNDELQYNLDDDGKKIRICEIGTIKYIKLDATKKNEYFTINNGQRITKNDVENTKNILKEPIEIYSASEFDNEVFGYIEKSKLKKIKPNQNIYQGKTILLNTGGSVGAIRFKNHNYEYTTIDNIIIYKSVQGLCYIDYLYYQFKFTMNSSKFNYSNTLRGNDLEKANLIIKVPEIMSLNNKEYSSISLQMAITKNIEKKLERIKFKEKTLNTIDILNQQQITLLINNFFNKKLEDNIIVNGIDIKLNEIEFEEIQAHASNEYFEINNGQRLKKTDLEESKEGIINPIEVYSASEFNEHILGYIEKDKLSLISPNQNIYKGKTILLNTGGSVGAIRFKNNDFEYTVIDNVIVYVAIDNKAYLSYIYYSLKSIMDNSKFNYNNTLRGSDLVKANLIIKIPKYKDIDTYQLQKSISQYLENGINKIKGKTINSRKLKKILGTAKGLILNFKEVSSE